MRVKGKEMRKYGDYFVEEKKIIKDIYGYAKKSKIIFRNCRIENFKMEEDIDAEEYIFINCRFPQQIQFKNFEGSIKFTFIHCLIEKMQVVDVFLPGLKFICCEINESTLERATLPGMVFGSFLERLPEKVEKYVRKKIPGLLEVCYIKDSSFLFCEMNNMIVDNVQVFRTGFKHCSLEALRICDRSEFIDVDLRGTKILNSDLGKCKFEKIRFNKRRPLVKFLLSTRKFLFKFRYSKDNTPAEIKRKKIDNAFTEFIRLKKIGIYQKGRKKRVDFLSPTEFKKVLYDKADFSEEYFFYYHLHDLGFIFSYKKRKPVTASIFFFFVNFLSPWANVIRAVLVIFSCTLLYYLWGVFEVDVMEIRGDISPLTDGISCLFGHFLLSAKVFANMEIYPFLAGNTFTDIVMVIETMFGYFYVGVLVAFIVYSFTRKDSIPLSKGDNN